MNNEELVQLYQHGDKQALNELLEQNKGIINKIINRFYINSNSFDREDLFQEGSIGLMTAANKYDFNNPKKAKFITYAVNWINHKVIRFLTQKNTNEEISLDKPVETDGNTSIIDMINSSENIEENVVDSIYQLELKEDLKQSMLQINSLREREIISFNFGLNSTIPLNMSEIGMILNITPGRVNQDKTRALRKLRTNACNLPIQEYRNERNEEIQERKYNNIDTLICTIEDVVQHKNKFNYTENIGGFNYEKNTGNSKHRAITEGI